MDNDAPTKSPPGTADRDVAVAIEEVAERIFVVRGRRVMVDVDLATLYGVRPNASTSRSTEPGDRFPETLCFS